MLRSINSRETDFANKILINFNKNILTTDFYNQNKDKILYIGLSRFSLFWVNKIIEQEEKMNVRIDNKSIFFLSCF